MSLIIKRKLKPVRVLLLAGLVLLSVILAAITFYGNDITSAKKMAFSEAVTSLIPAKTQAENYLQVHGTLEGVEASEKKKLPIKERQQYLAVSGGVLIGINYKQEVTVVLTPVIKDKFLLWKCYSSVKDATPLSCEGGL